MVDDRYTYIVMPFCPSGPLSKLIVNHGIANEIEAIEYFKSLPEFNAEIFTKITGIKIEAQS